MKSMVLAAVLSLLAAVPTFAAPRIITSDVTRFYKVYDAAGGHPSVEQLDRDYLARGSDGLHEFAKARNVTAQRIFDNIEKNPQTYTTARACMAALPGVKRRLTASFEKLARLYPQAKFPPVTLVVGRGRPVGITDASGVLIGLEAMCSATFMNPNLEDRFVHNIAHEYGHIQQPADIQAMNPGDPGMTVLFASLVEGIAELNAQLISGDIGQSQERAWAKGHEAAIDAAFLRDQDSTDLSKWLYNGPGDAAHPSDLGYWVGYLIAKSYYDRAPDKRQALIEIFNMHDPKAFLAKSGWKPATR